MQVYLGVLPEVCYNPSYVCKETTFAFARLLVPAGSLATAWQLQA